MLNSLLGHLIAIVVKDVVNVDVCDVRAIGT